MKQCKSVTNTTPLPASPSYPSNTGTQVNLGIHLLKGFCLKHKMLPEMDWMVSLVLKRLYRYCTWACSEWVLCVLNIPSSGKAQVLLRSRTKSLQGTTSSPQVPLTLCGNSEHPQNFFSSGCDNFSHSYFINLDIFIGRFSSLAMSCLCAILLKMECFLTRTLAYFKLC